MTGVICVDKPEQLTSFGAVARLRRAVGEKKAGHAGTLDPMATGVLPVFFGGATRFIGLLPDQDKAYRAAFRLGETTDTLDRTGTVLLRRPVAAGEAEVRAALGGFRGTLDQLPPMYSAVQKDGVRLYELARRGIEVERETRRVVIRRLELTAADEAAHTYEIEVVCSKGTYIRSLIADLGEALGCGAVMTALRRTQAAGFTLDDCIPLAQADDWRRAVIPLERALAAYPAVSVTEAQAVRFANGGALSLDRLHAMPSGALLRVYAPDRRFLGLGRPDEAQGLLLVERVYQER